MERPEFQVNDPELEWAGRKGGGWIGPPWGESVYEKIREGTSKHLDK